MTPETLHIETNDSKIIDLSLPFIGGHQKRDLVALPYSRAVLHILDGIRNEEVFTALLVTHATNALLHQWVARLLQRYVFLGFIV